jgi:hypothetical protein
VMKTTVVRECQPTTAAHSRSNDCIRWSQTDTADRVPSFTHQTECQQCSGCRRWVLPDMLSLSTSKRPLGTVTDAGLCVACTRCSGRRASVARLAPSP